MFTYKITKASDRTSVIIESDPRDILVWERSSKLNRTMSDLMSGGAMNDHYGIAYAALRRQGKADQYGKPAEFEAAYLVEVTDEEPEPDPTQ